MLYHIDHVSDQILQHQRPSRARGLSSGALDGPGPGQGALYAGRDSPNSQEPDRAIFQDELSANRLRGHQALFGRSGLRLRPAGYAGRRLQLRCPVERVYDEKYVMRLDRGPTCSFKDFAARVMGRLIQYFLSQEGRSILILTATSGDTGSAVAHAFYGLDNVLSGSIIP